MKENDEEEYVYPNEEDSDSTEEEEEETDSNSSEDEDEDEVEEDDASASNLGKKINKHKRKVKKTVKKTKNQFKAKLQLISLVVIVLAFLGWGAIEKTLHWLSGIEEITIADKTTANGCFEIVTTENESYCLDQTSYDLAVEGKIYELQQYQYYHVLKAVD